MKTDNEIVFLNHSSLLVKSQKTSVLCDPWFRGSAFNNGWRLLADNSHNINDLDFDYIWISHEHPDHFSIPTLTQLSSPSPFLYQRTGDRKVFDFLSQRQHSIQELDDSQPVQLDDLKLTTFVSDGYDTAALFEFANGDAFLNINDARIELGDTMARIQKCCPPKLDAIAIQFSYANWAGNEGDEEIPLDQQDLVLTRIVHICKALKPSKVLLFASYVFYSHEENFYWNRSWLPYVVDVLEKSGVSVIVARPDQCFAISEMASADYRTSNAQNMAFWQNLSGAEKVVDFSDKTKTIDDVREGYRSFYDRLWSENELGAAKTFRNADFRLRVRLCDLEQTVELYLFIDRLAILDSNEGWDCMISTETLLFLLKNRFGRGTTTVNGRIQFNYETAHRFFIFFFIPYANNIARHFTDQRLSPEVLDSVRNTSVMMSIFKFHNNAVERFREDLSLFDA